MRDKFERDARLDLAKALAISFVLFWHLKPLKFFATGGTNIFAAVNILLKTLYFQVTLVAVPLFILVSLYIFYQKIENSSNIYIFKRLNRLGQVFLFWTFCQFAFYYGNIFVKSMKNGAVDYSIPMPIPKLVMLGGPSLPIVGGSVFYFNFILFLVVSISFLFFFLRKFPVIFVIAGAVVAIGSMIYFEILNLSGRGLLYWRVENFLIYIPVSYFIYKQDGNDLSRYMYLCWFGFLVFLVQDIVLRNIGYTTGAYSRCSIVFGSVAIFITILSMSNVKKNAVSYLLSRHSLGIYATHKYMQFFVIIALQYFGVVKPIYISGFPVEFRVFIIAVLTFLLTALTVLLLYRTPLKRFVI